MVAVLWVAKRKIAVHLVVVSASAAGPRQVPGFLKIFDDLSHCSFGDSDRRGDIPEAGSSVAGNAFEHVRVVRDEPPEMVLISRT